MVGITLEGAPAQNATTPGGTVNATLTVKSTGNVAAANIPLALETSTGLSVSGLPATVSLGLGETKTFPLTLTASSGSLNDTLNATLTASFGQDLDGNPYKANAVIAVSVRSAETLPIERSAQTAASAQNAQLAQNLASLAEVTAQLQQKPGDAPLCGRLTLLYDQLLQLADVNPGLTSLKPQIQALRNLAATCNTPQLLTDSAQFFTNNFTLPVVSATPAVSLVPSSVTLEPGQGTTFNLRLENKGTQPATFNLSLDNLPAGVTATLNRSSVTLGAGEVLDASSANPVTLTLSQTPTTAQTFTGAGAGGAGRNQRHPHRFRPGADRAVPGGCGQRHCRSRGDRPDPDHHHRHRPDSQRRQSHPFGPGATASARLDRNGGSDLAHGGGQSRTLHRNPPGESGYGQHHRPEQRHLSAARQPADHDQRTDTGAVGGNPAVRGMPITATVRAEPALVAPGNPTVKTVIEATSRAQ